MANKIPEEVAQVLNNANNTKKVKKQIEAMNKTSLQMLTAILKKTKEAQATRKLTQKEINDILGIISEKEKQKTLLKTTELRPATWSKTITVFDVYETDEEGFMPYISPLATVGVLNTDTTTQQQDDETADETTTETDSTAETSTDTTTQQTA